MMIVIRGGRLFSATDGNVVADGVVAINEGRIAYAGPRSGFVQPQEEATLIDAGGRTVLPGLIDLHVHMIITYKRPVEYHLERAIGATMMNGVANCERALRAGITAVRDCGAGHLGIFALRDSINSGEVKGPRIFAAGKAICMTGGSSWEALCREADGPDECRKAAREQLRRPGSIFVSADGADLLKVMATDQGYNRTRVQMEVEEMAAVADEAHKMERRVAAHVGGAEGAIRCVKAGIDSIEHGNVLDEASIDAMANAGTAYVPTLDVYWEPAVLGAAAGFSQHEIGYCKKYYEPHKRSFELALNAGIKIGAGTDSGGLAHVVGKSMHQELQLLVDYGMKPVAALRAATAVAADILGQEARLGTLEVGKSADVLIVDGDPTTKIGDIRNTWLVLRDGQVVVDNRK